jgi:hypothetical protein
LTDNFLKNVEKPHKISFFFAHFSYRYLRQSGFVLIFAIETADHSSVMLVKGQAPLHNRPAKKERVYFSSHMNEPLGVLAPLAVVATRNKYHQH